MALAARICLLVMASAVTGKAWATPLVSPYATKLLVSYEGGYRLDLEVCGDVLCKMEVVLPEMRFTVPKEHLRSVVEPNIRQAQFFIDPSRTDPTFVSIRIPNEDLDRKHLSKQKVFVFEFSGGALKKVEEVEQPSLK